MHFNTPLNHGLTAVLLSLLSLHTTSAHADTISGNLEFSFKPPAAGIIYIDSDKTAHKHATIDQKGNQFSTKIAVSSPASQVSFSNSDQVVHNIYASDFRSGVKFDVGLMEPGTELDIDVDWNNDSIIRIGCKIHPKMRTYIANINSGIYQTMEYNSKQHNYPIELKDVPEESTTVNFMIPKYDPISTTLAAGDTVTVNLTKKGKPKGTLTLSRQ